MSEEEKREGLRRSLKAKINAGRISRMTNKNKEQEFEKMKEQLKKELGPEFEKTLDLAGNI